MSHPSVVVAVLTYQRTDGLRRSLDEIRKQLDLVRGSRLIVIDNDVEPSAATTVEQLVDLDPRVSYHHEPEPGIAAARNRALAAAGEADLLVFIDDDEQPADAWLANLVAAWERYDRPTAVVGPVVSLFASELDPWIAAGEFFNRLRHVSGTPVTTAASNNLLLDLAEVRRMGLRFDAAFGLSGGSDTVFTRALISSGGRMVWCDEAIVYDIVPPERATREWVRARAERLGNSDTRASVHLAEPGRERTLARLTGSARAGIRVAAGAARWGYGKVRGSVTDEAKGSRTLLRGTGMLRGAWGSVVNEYSR